MVFAGDKQLMLAVTQSCCLEQTFESILANATPLYLVPYYIVTMDGERGTLRAPQWLEILTDLR